MTVYDMNKERCDWLAANGRPAAAEIAKHFKNYRGIDLALGFKGAASHWYSGRNFLTKGTDALCARWLSENGHTVPKMPPPPVKMRVICPNEIAPMAARLLAAFGCDVVTL